MHPLESACHFPIVIVFLPRDKHNSMAIRINKERVMAVPDFQSFFKPLLDVAADGKEHSMKEAEKIIAG